MCVFTANLTLQVCIYSFTNFLTPPYLQSPPMTHLNSCVLSYVALMETGSYGYHYGVRYICPVLSESVCGLKPPGTET